MTSNRKLVALACGAALTLALVPARELRADGCFLCEGGGYVKFKGSDTFEKRKKAEKDFKCKVTGTTGSCNNPKGTVERAEGAQVAAKDAGKAPVARR